MSPADLPVLLAVHLAAEPGTVRVALDGPPCAEPGALADSLIAPLQALGRPAVHVESSWFWRDASLRLEYGRRDVEAYGSWLDHDALRREVLVPIVGRGDYLPSLRDPMTNRSTREPVRSAAPGTVLIVSGGLLQGLGLPFDVVMHLAVSPAARDRRTDADLAWTLPAFDDYDATARPAEYADVVIKLEDPRHPAVRGLRPRTVREMSDD